MLEAAAQHARYEAEVGGYVAAEAAEPVLHAGRAAFAALTGMSDAEVVFTTGALNALDLLLGSWPAGPLDRRRTVACLPGEYGPNLALLAAQGFERQLLPTLEDGRVALDDAAFALKTEPPDLVHLTAVASHSGVVQPLSMIAELCRQLGLPLVVDAAQALGQVDCAVGADVDVLDVAQVDRRAAWCGLPCGAHRSDGAVDSAAAGAGLGAVVFGGRSAGIRRSQYRCASGIFDGVG